MKTMFLPTLLEIRKDDKVYLVDTFTGSYAANRSFRELRENDELVKKFWPENEDWGSAVENAKLLYPAFPQEFCQRNIRLSEIVSQDAYELCIDPPSVMKKYVQSYNEPPQYCGLWTYIFILFKIDAANDDKPDLSPLAS